MAAVVKKPGDMCTVTLSFQHVSGPGGSYDIGIGLAPGNGQVTDWFASLKVVPATLGLMTHVIQFIWPSNYTNRSYDALKFIQVAGGPRDPGGNGFKIADWDRDVYVQSTQDTFSELNATYA